MNPTVVMAVSWMAVLLLILAVIVMVGFGSGVWPFTQLPPGSLGH